MGVNEYFDALRNDYTLRSITMGTAVLGIACGMLGSFAVLRKQSLLGDAISHAALPGIAIAFMLTGIKDPILFFAGAIISGIAGTIWIRGITTKTHLKTDTALGIILSVFFGFGMLLLTMIQKQPNANQAGLDKFLFGQAATIMIKDVLLMTVVGGAALIVLIVFWKEFKILSFDPQFAKTMGFNIKFLDILLTSLIVVVIVLGLQTVGVVLMSAMLLAPAAAARQWTNRLEVMVILSSFFGAVSGVAGTAVSASSQKIATGPVIVLIAVFIVFLSFLFAPERGLLFRQFRYRKSRINLNMDKTLSLMYEFVLGHEDYTHPHSVKVLTAFQGFHKKYLKLLEHENLIQLNNENWSLTHKGYEKAKNQFNDYNSL